VRGGEVMADLSVREMEEYVRERWERVVITQPTTVDFDGEWCLYLLGTGKRFIKETANECWQAAYDFTVEREEEIRQGGENIKQLEDLLSHRECLDHVECIRRRCWQARVLVHEQARLAELRKGWRG